MDVIGFSEAATANSRIEIINANPDSSSGIVTVPKTIASGETVTIPAGRTAILPDLVVEGDLLVEGTVFIPTGSTYTKETIKTESISNVAGSTVVNVTDIAKSSIVTPALALKANTADLKEIGVDQTWQDVTASRALGVTYTNSTGKPIVVSVAGANGGGNGNKELQLNVDGIVIQDSGVFSTTGNTSLSVIGIVNNGSTYRVSSIGAVGLTLSAYLELR